MRNHSRPCTAEQEKKAEWGTLSIMGHVTCSVAVWIGGRVGAHQFVFIGRKGGLFGITFFRRVNVLFIYFHIIYLPNFVKYCIYGGMP